MAQSAKERQAAFRQRLREQEMIAVRIILPYKLHNRLKKRAQKLGVPMNAMLLKLIK